MLTLQLQQQIMLRKIHEISNFQSTYSNKNGRFEKISKKKC